MSKAVETHTSKRLTRHTPAAVSAATMQAILTAVQTERDALEATCRRHEATIAAVRKSAEKAEAECDAALARADNEGRRADNERRRADSEKARAEDAEARLAVQLGWKEKVLTDRDAWKARAEAAEALLSDRAADRDSLNMPVEHIACTEAAKPHTSTLLTRRTLFLAAAAALPAACVPLAAPAFAEPVLTGNALLQRYLAFLWEERIAALQALLPNEDRAHLPRFYCEEDSVAERFAWSGDVRERAASVLASLKLDR